MKMAGILLAFFIFTVMLSMVNTLNIFDYKMTESGYDPNVNTINETTKGIVDLSQTDIDDPNVNNPDAGGWGAFVNTASALKDALAMVVYIRPTLIAYGVPSAMATAIQGIISLVEALFLISFVRRFRVS